MERVDLKRKFSVTRIQTVREETTENTCVHGCVSVTKVTDEDDEENDGRACEQ